MINGGCIDSPACLSNNVFHRVYRQAFYGIWKISPNLSTRLNNPPNDISIPHLSLSIILSFFFPFKKNALRGSDKSKSQDFTHQRY